MKNFTKNTIATLALILLTQTLSASYSTKSSKILDVEKFSSLWQEVNVNNNEAIHLSNALNTVVDEVICTIS